MNTRLQANSVASLTLVNRLPCTVNALHGINTTTAAAFVQVFDAAATTDVTLGTTVAAYVIPLAASGVAEGLVGAEAVFANGIVVASTTTATGSTTAVTHFRAWVC